MFSRLSKRLLVTKPGNHVVSAPSRVFSVDSTPGGFTYPAPRKLDGVVNMEMFATQPVDILTTIWTEHHAQSATSMASVISAADFNIIQKRAVNTPFFTFPVMRETGHFVLLSQFQDKSFLLTYLEDYRTNPANAQPYMTITAYDELALTHGVVLLRADICALATLSKTDAERILRQMVEMYRDDNKYQHIYNFNKVTEQFDFEETMKLMNSI